MAAEHGAFQRRSTMEGAGAASLLRPLVRVMAGPAVGVDEGQLSRRAVQRDTFYRRALALADVVAVATALFVASSAVGADGLRPAATGIVVALVAAAKAAGLYDRDEHVLRKTTLEDAPKILQVATLGALVTWLADGVVVAGSLDRPQVLALWLLLLGFLLVARALARRLTRAAVPEERCLIIGEGAAIDWARRKLAGAQAVNATLVGSLPLDAHGGQCRPVPELGRLDTVASVIEEHRIDRVIVAPEASDSEQILDVVRFVKALGVKVSVLPRLFEVVGSSVEFDDIDGMTLLGVRRYGLTKSSRVMKRSMDVTGSLVLLVLLAPLLAMIAAAIKVGSPGPVLFRQPRVGRDNEVFEILKFRTMVQGAEGRKPELRALNEAGVGLFKIARDPRITPIGRYLRRTSLDELPQLFNVLRGEMSLVGPRPLVVDEDRHAEGWQRHRLMLSPGMTGQWQVLGSPRIPLNEMLKIDYLYGANWSLWEDVKILLRTLPLVLNRRGM